MSHLPEGARAELDAALDAYLEAKTELLTSSTRVLGSFISEEFVAEMQAGTIALLDGLCEGGDKAEPRFLDAKKHFRAMAREGAIELVEEYINALQRDARLKIVAGLFPERQEELLSPYNRAVVLFNRVVSGELGGEEACPRLLEAVSLLRESELALGGISELDVEEQVERRRRSNWDTLSRVVFWAGVAFLLVRIVVRAGGLRHLLHLMGLLA